MRHFEVNFGKEIEFSNDRFQGTLKWYCWFSVKYWTFKILSAEKIFAQNVAFRVIINFYLATGTKVSNQVDGGSCWHDLRAYCVQAGCDHRLGSDMRRDKCGICGGDGSTCTTISGSYNERGSFGYNQVLKIPAGSANIEITQRGYRNQKDDDNYLGKLFSKVQFPTVECCEI